jgi:hypothetical protein
MASAETSRHANEQGRENLRTGIGLPQELAASLKELLSPWVQFKSYYGSGRNDARQRNNRKLTLKLASIDPQPAPPSALS